jgi:SAM-dependent methyltransferase
MMKENLLTHNNSLSFEALQKFMEKPAPFTPGNAVFWNDPHISQHLLTTHLDPNDNLASRIPATIESTLAWIMKILDLQPEDVIIDLGCGPGLYSSQFAQMGLKVTGVDYSERSINYARETAQKQGLDITYRYQNYLEVEDENLYDAAFLIYGDFCPLSAEQRAQLLKNVHRALKPGGHFIFDVSTRVLREKYGQKNEWNIAVGSGFWKPEGHLVLSEGFDYPEQAIYLNQYVVIEANGDISVYRNWFQDYNPETITAELEANNFTVQSLWGDLAGTPYTDDSEWIGIVAQK